VSDLDRAALRAELPVLERVAYLNTGTSGPAPRAALAAAGAAVRAQMENPRGTKPAFDALLESSGRLRERVAALLGADADEVALTGSTTAGCNTVLWGLGLGPGDEVLTSDEEHPGLLAPLAAASARHGFAVRVAPFGELAGGVGPATKLVACSHVSWVGGKVVDTDALRAAEAPVLLDGAQGLGAVPVDVRALGCDFYAASGQKWLCGPTGSGYLYVRREALDAVGAPWPGFWSLADADDPLRSELKQDAGRLDGGVPPPERSAWSLAALDVLEGAGIDGVLRAGPAGAERLAGRLAEHGLEVAPRGDTTLVSWSDAAAGETVERLAGANVVVRELPGRDLVRASVGAWTSDEELERLVELVAGAATSRS
jgi:L-cysteine/cystine lyase